MSSSTSSGWSRRMSDQVQPLTKSAKICSEVIQVPLTTGETRETSGSKFNRALQDGVDKSSVAGLEDFAASSIAKESSRSFFSRRP